MRIVLYPVLILALVFGGWTYFNLYRLTAALVDQDDAALSVYVDLDRIRAQHVAALSHALGVTPGANGESLIQRSVEAVGTQAANTLIDLQWIRTQLSRPTGGKLGWPSFAFYESPRRLLLRYGELGHEPVHAYFSLEDWKFWRLTEIYE